ncbi:MAG: hypothetical protein KKF62_08025 [Bacteroidetes bacterium]|nr:hypothetical protein [Bacteroidota bacterium]MBU1117197.1 hypothetical protein [Bacteroidota bacterium]MBU1798498.1 hypothetical protein [Bacteroidota bacterium]
MNEAHNSTKQGLNEVIEYLERDKKELLQEILLAEQQILDGKYLSDTQVEKRLTARYGNEKNRIESKRRII